MSDVKKSVIDLVDASPAAVAAHARTDWLALFAPLHVVEDPVGSAPHIGGLYDVQSGRRGHAPLARFYDTFIAPNDIRFHVHHDVVCGLHMVRDLEIEIAMSPVVTVRVPMHLLYELVNTPEGLRIQRLAAHWEPVPMVASLLRMERDYLKVLWRNNLRLLRTMGLSGMVGFAKGFFSVGEKGRALVRDLLWAMQGGELPVVAKSCPGITLAGSGHVIMAPEAVDLLRGSDCPKLLVAGDVVSASIRLRDGRQGVLFFYLGRRPLHVVSAVLYLDETAHG